MLNDSQFGAGISDQYNSSGDNFGVVPVQPQGDAGAPAGGGGMAATAAPLAVGAGLSFAGGKVIDEGLQSLGVGKHTADNVGDVARDAGIGATIGSLAGPPGTVVGGVIGGAAGLVNKTLFHGKLWG